MGNVISLAGTILGRTLPRSFKRLENDCEAALRQWRLSVEWAQFAVSGAERRYRAVDPDNRLVARTLEQELEEALRPLELQRLNWCGRRPCARALDHAAGKAACPRRRPQRRRDRKDLLRTLISMPPLSSPL